jgi:hypothetical protein
LNTNEEDLLVQMIIAANDKFLAANRHEKLWSDMALTMKSSWSLGITCFCKKVAYFA